MSWRWYSYDPATLRCVDKHYWLSHWDRFAYVDKTKLSWKNALEELPLIDEASSSFLEDAARGKLPAVSWVDPNFKDSTLYGGDSNDDHPPSDVRDGQLLVLSRLPRARVRPALGQDAARDHLRRARRLP